MQIPEEIDPIYNVEATRAELDVALDFAVDCLARRIAKIVKRDEPVYLIGSGFDFSEMGAKLAERFSHLLVGVAFIWTVPRKYALPSGERAFSIA
ncbi:hypothetical protein [Rhizobium sp. Rhizsp42]|uniref:hypothetical protein n=1 Tax=Rhizobium sp. Rhizsp42 TaxID=3243034 RepID=UPI000DD70D14